MAAEMIERVAKAISVSFHEEGYIEGLSDPHEWNEFIKAARLAIAAMREPTEEMIKIIDHGGGQWEDIIDAALKE